MAKMKFDYNDPEKNGDGELLVKMQYWQRRLEACGYDSRCAVAETARDALQGISDVLECREEDRRESR